MNGAHEEKLQHGRALQPLLERMGRREEGYRLQHIARARALGRRPGRP